ncbi:hypothetical protein J2W91_003075 [Paenibacillus amylolyticus]|uniref:Uncharacterized protein n=1 Tax=Paenibacillus amylolyticus TaxID=1451 RepID=A0AAP5H2I1_PAEAM|nr:hypothetical protein [Paenibacillus amylolyticus]MDR6724607.1 hypothetical protein [Paenibacillus amylolyticus]
MNARKPPSIKGERFASPAHPDPSASASHEGSRKRVMPAILGHNPGKEKVKSGYTRLVAPGSGALTIAVAPRWPEYMDARKPPSIKGERFASPAHPDPSAPASHEGSRKRVMPANLGHNPWERTRQGSLCEGQFI